MAVANFKGNTTLIGATTGTIGVIDTIGIAVTTGSWETTGHDTTTGRTHLGTWSDGTFTLAGTYDPTLADHEALETAAENGTSEVWTVLFVTGESWAATCFMTDFSLEGDKENGWKYSATFQKTGDSTWTHAV